MSNKITGTATNGAITIGSSSTQVVVRGDDRWYLALTNDSDEDMYISLGEAAVMNEGIRINANGGIYEMYAGAFIYMGAINAICTSGSKNLTYSIIE